MKEAPLGGIQGWNMLGEAERTQEGVESMKWLHKQVTRGASIGKLTKQMCTLMRTNFRLCYQEVVLGETRPTGSVDASSGKLLKDARRKTCMLVLKHFDICSTRSKQVKNEEEAPKAVKKATPVASAKAAPKKAAKKEESSDDDNSSADKEEEAPEAAVKKAAPKASPKAAPKKAAKKEEAKDTVARLATTCEVEKARIAELKKEAAIAKDSGAETGVNSCQDHTDYSQPYEKREYDKQMKGPCIPRPPLLTRLLLQRQIIPVDVSTKLIRAHVTATLRLRKTVQRHAERGLLTKVGLKWNFLHVYRECLAGMMGFPYVHYVKVVNKSTPILTSCQTQKARKRCKSKRVKSMCNKTCGDGEVDKDTSLDHSHWYRNKFAYETKAYSSYCEFHKAQGRCDFDAGRDLFSGSTQKSLQCQKTCTGKGENTMEAKEMRAPKYETKSYKTQCEFRIKSMSNPCKTSNPRAYHSYQARAVKQNCAKTCTGKGNDNQIWAQPYRHRTPEVKKVHKYTTKASQPNNNKS